MFSFFLIQVAPFLEASKNFLYRYTESILLPVYMWSIFFPIYVIVRTYISNVSLIFAQTGYENPREAIAQLGANPNGLIVFR